MAKYKGRKENFIPNYRQKNKSNLTERQVVVSSDPEIQMTVPQVLKALESDKTSTKTDYGEKIHPKIGVIREDYGYLNLMNLEVDEDFDYDDETLVNNDYTVKSYRNKLLGSAASYKRSYDFNDVDQPVAEYADHLYNTLPWDDLHRYVHNAEVRRYSVIQILWENIDYELVGDKLYASEQRIYGFKQEDPRDFSINTDLMQGAYGDVIYTPTRLNITRDYPYNFIIIRNKVDYAHQEGISELRELKSLINLKQFALKTWARFIKKSAIPSVIAIYKTTLRGDAFKLEASVISGNMAGVENGSSIAAPNIDNVIMLTPNNQMDFVKVFNYINSEIQLRILGTTLLGGQTETSGSYASAKVGASELEDAVKQVALTLQSADNRVITLSIQQRFGTATKLPQLLFDLAEKATLEQFKACFDYKVPVDLTEMRKVLPVAAGVKETADNQWHLGSPDGTLMLEAEPTDGGELTEEDLLEKDRLRKEEEEADKLANKES